MRSNVCDRVAINAYWRAAMTLSQNWFLPALIRFKRQRRRNAGRLIDIVPEWYWEKALHSLRWKTSTAPNDVVHLFWQKSSVTEFLRIIFISHSRILPVSGRGKRWSGLFKARTLQRTKSITSMPTAQPRCLTTPPRERRSTDFLMAFQ